VTFAEAGPVLARYCGECHQPGGAGPFSVLDYASARLHATQIAEAMTRGVMPPWKGSSEFGAFVNQPRPSDGEIALIRRWVEAGSEEGRPRVARHPATDGWRLGRPDLVVTLSEPYMLRADGVDVFRIFAIPVRISSSRFVRGLEFRPGNARVVHHANIRIDRTAVSFERDAAEPGPGYDGLLARTALFPSGHFLGWTPGQVAPLVPESLAWRLDPGSYIVVQLHMQPSGKVEPVQPSIGLFFGNDAPRRTPAMLRLGRQNIDIPPGESAYTVADSYTLPVDAEIQSVQPHAHYRARHLRGTVVLPDGSTRTLIGIDDWDFRWQHLYRFERPFWVPAGTKLTMTYLFDNSAANPRNPRVPPERAVWGQRSSEEMGDLWIQVLTRDAADLGKLNRDFRPKAVAEDLVGYEGLIARDPGDAALHDDAAILYQELGRQQDAVGHFEAAARLRPAVAVSHFNLGTALSLAGEQERAIASYERALAIDPRYAHAHNNLASALEVRGRRDEAVRHYEQALAIDPRYPEAHNNLGRLLVEVGQPDRAATHLREAVRLKADYVNAHVNLGTAVAAQGQVARAIAHYRDALRLDPSHPIAHNNVGSMLLESGDVNAALVHLKEALRVAPDYAEAHYHVGRALRRGGDVTAAIEHLTRAAILKPEWAPPRDESKQIETSPALNPNPPRH
jgi:tetratricopeptide (TPR) repeat protein